MIYNFDSELANRYGVDEAIMINNFSFWISKNKANDKHFYDGRYWTYNSVSAFTELFTFWTEKQLRRILASLIDQKVLITGNYNKKKSDKTTWYSFVNESSFLGTSHSPKREDQELPNGQMAYAQMGKPLPDNKTYTDNKTSDSLFDENSFSSSESDGVSSFKAKQPKKIKEKKPDSEIFKSCREFWLEQVHPGWTFGPVQGSHLYAIIAKLRQSLKSHKQEIISDQDVVDLFKHLCIKLSEFFKQKDLQVINSKYNEIIEDIKSSKNGHSQQKSFHNIESRHNRYNKQS